ncbi:MAG TPA: late competence protein ComER [Bacilli bacterium]
MVVGFIGTGNMGSILIDAFLKSDALLPAQIIASNRTAAKAEQLAAKYPGLHPATDNKAVAKAGELLFLCVKPTDYADVLAEIKDVLLPEQIIVSITSPVLIRHLEEQLPCKIAKVIPSITNQQLSGATLCMYGTRINDLDIGMLESLLSHISTPMRISESYTRVISDLSSCGPAFLAYFVEKFVEAAVERTGIPANDATKLAGEMVLGTGKLLTSGEFAPNSLRQRVTVPGGITAEALKILAFSLDGVFEQVLAATHAKYAEDVNKIEKMLCGHARDKTSTAAEKH